MTALADSPTAQHGRGTYRGPGGAVPGPVTITASCLLVLVLAMGTALAHMLRGDATAGDTTDNQPAGPASERSPWWSAEDEPADQPDEDHETRTAGRTSHPARTSEPPRPPGPAAPPGPAEDLIPDPPRQRNMQAFHIARELAAAGNLCHGERRNCCPARTSCPHWSTHG
jgi:hypothetical protein